jgi:tetratricopeptide (TPR) repeat protein
VSYYTPAEAQAVFAAANDAYYSKDYPTAIAAYLKLIDHGAGGADVLFNLGTTYLQAGDLGNAVLYLERARRLGRGDDVEAQLAMARDQLTDKVIGAQADEPFVQRLAEATRESAASGVFLSTWALAFTALLLMRVFRAHRLKLAIAAALMLVCAAVSGSIVAAHAYVESTIVDAVVIPAELKAREFPKDSAKVSFEVHSGLKVRVLESSGKFVRIRLPNGLEGWTERDGVADI